MTATNGTFISYRRSKGSMWALALYQRLTMQPDAVDVFYDIEELKAGPFDLELLEQIAARPYFVLVLTPGTLRRCRNTDDWLRREIEHAVSTRRIIVPVMTPGFNLRDLRRFLPSPAGDVVATSHGVELNHTFFSAGVDTMKHKLLTPTDRVATPQPDNPDKAREARITAFEAPPVTETALRRRARQQSWQKKAVIALGALVVLMGVALVGGVVLEPSNGSDPAGSGTAASSTSTPGPRARLGPNETLGPGERLESQNGNHTLAMTEQGQLVALTDYQQWWQQEGNGQPGAVAAMQEDGNFVVYGPDGTVLWATGTENNRGASVVIENDSGKGVLKVYSGNGTAVLWQRAQGEVEPVTTSAPSTTSSSTSSQAPVTKVKVPCLVNLTQAAAEQAVPSELKINRTYNELKQGDPKVGRVLSQSPACNALVDRGSTLSITVGSAGTTTSATPGTTTTTGSGGRSS